MSGESAIGWLQNPDGSRGKSWNPTIRCERVSAGCDNCYAFALHDTRYNAQRQHGAWPHMPPQYEQPFSASYQQQGMLLLPERLTDPLRWRNPQRVFVNSMSDLFHPGVPDDFIADVFGVMSLARQHTFIVLTKRAARMAHWTQTYYAGRTPWPNVCLGVSVEDQAAADERMPDLMRTLAAVRLVSAEPLLGPVDLSEYLWLTPTNAMTEERWDTHGWGFDQWSGGFVGFGPQGSPLYDPRPGFDWLIVGGESGPHARRMDMGWALDLLQQSAKAEIAVFVKQLGAVAAHVWGLHDRHGADMNEWPEYTEGLLSLRQRAWPTVEHLLDPLSADDLYGMGFNGHRPLDPRITRALPTIPLHAANIGTRS